MPQVIKRKIVLYDPNNNAPDLTKYVTSVVKKLNLISKSSPELIIIAPNSLEQGIDKKLPAGVPVIVMPQNSENLELLGFRTYPIRARELWSDNSISIDSELLRDWRAGVYFKTFEDSKAWRTGHNSFICSVGMVAGTVIESPHFGNFTPLVHGEFGMAQTALLKTEINGTPWLFCQLELPSNVAIEPAAKAITIKMFSDFGRTKVQCEGIYILGDNQLAKTLGLTVKGTAIPKSGIVLVDKLKLTEVAQINNFVEDGGTAVIMPQSDEVYQALNIKYNRTVGALFPAKHTGLNLGNFHYRQDLPVITFDNKTATVNNHGKGRYVLIGFDPRTIDLEKEPYLTITARRQYRALTQLLINAGAEFGPLDNDFVYNLNSTVKEFSVASLNTFLSIRSTNQDDTEWLKTSYEPKGWDKFQLLKTSTGKSDVQLLLTFDMMEVPDGDLVLVPGSFDDFDICYINGVKVGETSPKNTAPEKAWEKRRVYPIPKGLLRSGKNILAIRAWNRNAAKGWQVHIRGAIAIKGANSENHSFYHGNFRTSDDPYLLYQW